MPLPRGKLWMGDGVDVVESKRLRVRDPRRLCVQDDLSSSSSVGASLNAAAVSSPRHAARLLCTYASTVP